MSQANERKTKPKSLTFHAGSNILRGLMGCFVQGQISIHAGADKRPDCTVWPRYFPVLDGVSQSRKVADSIWLELLRSESNLISFFKDVEDGSTHPKLKAVLI